MKRCSKCREEKPFSEFNRNREGLQTYCRPCDNAAQRERYARNRESSILASKVCKDRRIEKTRDWILEYLVDHPCVDCGESDPVVLEFDHIKGVKLNHVSQMIRGYPLQKVIAEIEKCEVRCANCHRRVTAKRAGWWKSVGYK